MKAWRLICGREPGSRSIRGRGSGGGLASNGSRVEGSAFGLTVMR